MAYLEKLRSDRYNECAILLQKNMRRHIYRTRYVRMRNLAITLQCVARRKVAQAKLQSFREHKAAVTIQSCWRRYVARKQYLATQQFILKLQTGKYIN